MKRLAAFITLLGMLLAPASAPAAPAVPITHVIVIAMENHSRSEVIGTSSAPYITSLSKTYGQATQYVDDMNPAHPSAPQYLDVTGGTNAGVTNDCSPSPTCGSNGASIFSQAGHRSYEEGMPTACDKTAGGTQYYPKHNPEVYYRTLTDCQTTDLPLPATGVPNLGSGFTFITPNECHDMHSNPCAGSSCTVCQGDTWLKGYLPKLLASPRYQAGDTAIFIWWDEGSANNILPFVVVSPYTHGVTYTGKIDHFSTLRTVEDLLGKGCIAGSCNRTSYATAFGLK